MAGGLATGLLGLLVLALAAPRAARTPPDTLVVGLHGEPRSLDPHVTTASSDFRVLVNLYEGLVRFGEGTLQVAPGLAESWDVLDGGRTYVFHLRSGVRFHDGSPCDAAAVKFNFDRMLRKDHPYHHTGPFPLADVFFGVVREVVAGGPFTVRFVLDEPFAPLLANLAYPTGLIVSPAAVRRHGRAYGRHPSGTGPFRFVSWDFGRRIVLERSPERRDPSAGVERIIYRPIGAAMTRVAELRAGGVDLVPEVGADNLSWFRAHPAFRVHEKAGPHLWFVILDTSRRPFDDVRVRRAVNLAVDKRSLARHVLQDTAAPAAGPVPAAFSWARNPQVRPYPFDPARARRLLEESGYGTGISVTMLVPQGGSGMLQPVAMAAAIQADLARVGVRVNIETYEWNTYLDKVNGGLRGRARMAAMAWMTNDPDTLPYLALRTKAHPPQGFNSGYYSDERVDRLVERARRTTDRQERARLYRRLQRIVHEEAPWLFIASWKQNAVTGRGVQGFRLQPSFLLHLDRVRKR